MVGKLSRIRVSSVTRTLPPRISVGTLKSTRTSARFPRTSRSRRVSFAIAFTRARNRHRLDMRVLPRAKHARAQRTCEEVQPTSARFWQVVLCQGRLAPRLQAFAQALRPSTQRIRAQTRVPLRKT